MGAQEPEKIGISATTTSVSQDEDVRKTTGTSDEKVGVAATTTVVPDESQALMDDERAVSKPDRNLNAAIWTITCGVALPCIPIVIITAILLSMVLGNRVLPEDGWPELRPPVANNSAYANFTSGLQYLRHNAGPAYLVFDNPSTITTIASWTSRVIPYLSSSIMALVAFFAARRIATKSHKGDGSDLPSPKELTLLIELLGGKTLEPLKDTLMHRWENKTKLVDPIPLAFSALFIITMLGFLIPAVDTWFGIATTATQIVFLPRNLPTRSSFGRKLSHDRCPYGPGNFSVGSDQWLSCNLDYEDHGVGQIFGWLADGYEPVRMMSDNSDTNFIANHTEPGSSDSTILYYLADTRRDRLLDFKASTFAISTQCAPITRQCLPGVNHSSYYENTNFTCTPGFQANFTFPGTSETVDADASDNSGGENYSSGYPATGLAFSPDAQLSRRVGAHVDSQVMIGSVGARDSSDQSSHVAINASYSYVLPRNPLHFAAWSLGYPSTGSQVARVPKLFDDEQIYQNNYGKSLWVLNCSTTVYDVQYTWVNGSLYTFNATLASPGMGGLLSAPFALGVDEANYVLNSVAFSAGANNNSADLAATYAQRWSKAALALSIGAMVPANNILEQSRYAYTGPVARVPMIPLYILLGLKAIYVFAVILLAVGAYCFTHPAETEIVRDQLSTKGLAAAHFDTPDILQQKVVKELQERLTPQTPAVVDEKDPAIGGLKRSVTLAEMPDKKVGVVARADGAWRFAVVANGVWNGIKPIAVDLIGIEAKAGNLGAAGDVVNAWRK